MYLRQVDSVTSGWKHVCFLFLQNGLYPKPSFIQISFCFVFRRFNVTWKKYFLNFFFFMAMLHHFTTITLLISPEVISSLFVEDDEFRTECVKVVGMLWRQTLGNESQATKFCVCKLYSIGFIVAYTFCLLDF